MTHIFVGSQPENVSIYLCSALQFMDHYRVWVGSNLADFIKMAEVWWQLDTWSFSEVNLAEQEAEVWQ